MAGRRNFPARMRRCLVKAASALTSVLPLRCYDNDEERGYASTLRLHISRLLVPLRSAVGGRMLTRE